MVFVYTAAEAYWGTVNRAHKPNAIESAAFLVNAQADYTINFGGTPVETDALQNKLVMLYYLTYVLQWYAGEAGYVESQSPPQGGSSTLPSMTWVRDQLTNYEERAISGYKGTPGFQSVNSLAGNGYDDR